MAENGSTDQLVYGIIGNIPPDYHSADLRNYFSQFIESKGFHCFHFRHRPEKREENAVDQKESAGHITTTTSINDSFSKHKSTKNTKKTSCCVVRLKESKLNELIRMYHKKHWLDKKGESIASLCIVSKVKLKVSAAQPQSHMPVLPGVPQTSAADSDQAAAGYKTRREQKNIPSDREEFTLEDLSKLVELHPPDIMPNGNVGTPTMVFLEFIQQCRLPPIVIKKLGLSFPKTRTNKKYGNVPFDYGGGIVEADVQEEDDIVKSGDGKELKSQGEITETRVPGESRQDNIGCSTSTAEPGGNKSTSKWRKLTKTEKARRKELMSEKIEERLIGGQGQESGEDNDSCEEWERHEALWDDPANQERNKERLFEEEIELKWEKGGSGLVFYTDAQYWDEKDGDFDEKTADDLDVDMSGYYEPGAGDMDARDSITMRQEKRRRDGVEATDFRTVGIGKFEKHTRGFGRRILTRQGWKDGDGLGSTITGISEALENEGQNPRDRKGFGYRGEKLVHYAGTKRRAQKDVVISTIYDDPADTDPQEPLLRRHNHYGLKYRESIKFTKSSKPEDDTCS